MALWLSSYIWPLWWTRFGSCVISLSCNDAHTPSICGIGSIISMTSIPNVLTFVAIHVTSQYYVQNASCTWYHLLAILNFQRKIVYVLFLRCSAHVMRMHVSVIQTYLAQFGIWQCWCILPLWSVSFWDKRQQALSVTLTICFGNTHSARASEFLLLFPYCVQGLTCCHRSLTCIRSFICCDTIEQLSRIKTCLYMLMQRYTLFFLLSQSSPMPWYLDKFLHRWTHTPI